MQRWGKKELTLHVPCFTMKIFRSGNCRKRKIQTLVLILVIVVVYFLLQFFTLSKLGHFQGGKKVHLEDDGVNDAVPASRSGDSVEWNVKQPMIITAPRGVHPSDAFRYAEDMQGLFKCLESEVLKLEHDEKIMYLFAKSPLLLKTAMASHVQ